MKVREEVRSGGRFFSERLESYGFWFLLAVASLAALTLLYSGFCAFTWGKFTLFDYGVYTNMVWNSGHGRPFACLIDRNYLATHLSFTLALLGPLFRLWDHPFTLWVAQWFFLVGGAAILCYTAYKLRAPALSTGAVLLFMLAGCFTQQVFLSEFHGVTTYFLLFPWLYHTVKLNRRLVWLPWLLILGVREDAALIVIPFMLFFAVREDWRPGYVYAGLSLLYMVMAIAAIYPFVTGMSIFERRHSDFGHGFFTRFSGTKAIRDRLKALFWLGLPVLPFLRGRGWLPLVILPFLVLSEAMGSAIERQYSLSSHYPAAILVCIYVAMIEASLANRGEESGPRRRLARLAAAWVLIVVVGTHIHLGFLRGGGRGGSVYNRINKNGLQALRAARHIPRSGVLLCPHNLAGFCANRGRITDWRHLSNPHTRPTAEDVDIVFSELVFLDHGPTGYRHLIADNSFGVTYLDDKYIVLVRGAKTGRNSVVLAMEPRR